MCNFLIVDDESFIREYFRSLLEARGHICEEASNQYEAIRKIKKGIQGQGTAFDLILLDHHLDGGQLGIDILRHPDVGLAFAKDRVIVITGDQDEALAEEYAEWGAIGHLLKPLPSESQFWVTIKAALSRLKRIEQQQDWEEAYTLLEELGLLESIDQLREDVRHYSEQYIALKQIHEQLLSDLKHAGGQAADIEKGYEIATKSLNDTLVFSIQSIIPFLHFFKFTNHFWKDVEDLFNKDRLHFFILQSYLKRIHEHPEAQHSRDLSGHHYEYRIGRSYRLYFRPANDDHKTLVLERFGHKNRQDEIISFLQSHNEEPVDWGQFSVSA